MSGFIVALLQLVTGSRFRNLVPLFYAILPLLLFAYFLSYAPAVFGGEVINFHYSWIPSWNIHLDFRLDGLSLLFALLITGMGTLVFAFASAYMKAEKFAGRFFGFLNMFMASMLGLVLSDNVISLFCFWELTSISSFFLIGFKSKDAFARKSAFLSLAITGGGGLLLLTGFLLAAQIAGSFSLGEMVNNRDLFSQHRMMPVMLGLILMGAGTKSAQFPFHYWLPAAMKAPSPVSAYLHSATMVKAGVYLVARLTPAFNGIEGWNTSLQWAGGITMIYAALHAVFRTDLKSILAYSTVSALGILFFLFGLGTREAVGGAIIFILVHALYKGALFLIAGAIEHGTGTRDLTKLQGLRKHMPMLALAGLLAALSSGGIPLTLGFVGKETIYEALTGAGNNAWLAAAVLTNVLLFAIGFLAGIKPFTGHGQNSSTGHNRLLLWMPPLLLGFAGLAFGPAPGLLDGVANAAAGPLLMTAPGFHLKLWHGWNTVVMLSAATVAGGMMLYFLFKPSASYEGRLQRLKTISPENLFSGIGKGFEKFAAFFTVNLKRGYLRFYIFTIITFAAGILSYKAFSSLNFQTDFESIKHVTSYEAGVFLLMVLSIGITITTSSRLRAIAALGIVGLCICLIFVFYSAPDLAMTQFTIDTLTVVLFVLVLFKLPPFLSYSTGPTKLRDALLSIFFGLIICLIALEVMQADVPKEISEFYIRNAYPLAKGKNVVNVILVDFRGIDTMMEIAVLTIAAVGVYSLLKLEVNVNEKE